MFKHAWRKWEIASFPCIFTDLIWAWLEEWGMYALVPKGVAGTSSNNLIFSGCPLTPVMTLRWCTCIGHFPKQNNTFCAFSFRYPLPAQLQTFLWKSDWKLKKLTLKFHSPSGSTSPGSRTTKKASSNLNQLDNLLC